MVLLSLIPDRWLERDRWIAPGAVSNARWMSALLYAPKMFAFSGQITEWNKDFVNALEMFLTFTSLVYVRYWMQATIGRDAPVLDLALFKELFDLRNFLPNVADAALAKLKNHAWYLTPEIVVFSLCSPLVTDEDKSTIASKLMCEKQTEFAFGRPDFPIIREDTQLPDLVTPSSWFIFHMLGLKGTFLGLPVCEWETNSDYVLFHQYVSTVKVVNDPAERSIKMCSDIIQKITRCEKKRKNLLQVMERHREVVQDTKKKSLLLSLSELSNNNN